MIETIENSRTEFKVKLVDDLEETIIDFLNSKDGCIISSRSDTTHYSNIYIQISWLNFIMD